MAQWQAYQAHATKNSPTLVAGQTIAVNKYTVQVERYLSQGMRLFYYRKITPISTQTHAGGFAHVYLVRTATPVYNTTHHVLKRIAVPDEGMLTEVKKEVDIMVRTMNLVREY
jgi:AP2-associated kinase